jgi:hypothetical protein
MKKVIRVQFEIDGLHALMFAEVLSDANRAPGAALSESALAKSLVCAILEEDARDHAPDRAN